MMVEYTIAVEFKTSRFDNTMIVVVFGAQMLAEFGAFSFVL